MAALDISSIKKDAEARLEIADKAMELTRLVERVYPGARVVIDYPDATPTQEPGFRPAVNFADLSVMDKVVTVLRDHGAPMTLVEIYDQTKARGATVSKDTIISYLSRTKTRFEKRGDGMWALIETPRNGSPLLGLVTSVVQQLVP